MKRSNGKPHIKKTAFLAAVKVTGNISKAAEMAKIDRTSHYRWMRGDEQYEAAFEEAIDEAADWLEDEARRRAVDGVEETIYNKDGDAVGTRVKYSDTLLIFLLNGARPQKYRRVNEHTGTIEHKHTTLTDAVSVLVRASNGSANGSGNRLEGKL